MYIEYRVQGCGTSCFADKSAENGKNNGRNGMAKGSAGQRLKPKVGGAGRRRGARPADETASRRRDAKRAADRRESATIEHRRRFPARGAGAKPPPSSPHGAAVRRSAQCSRILRCADELNPPHECGGAAQNPIPPHPRLRNRHPCSCRLAAAYLARNAARGFSYLRTAACSPFPGPRPARQIHCKRIE